MYKKPILLLLVLLGLGVLVASGFLLWQEVSQDNHLDAETNNQVQMTQSEAIEQAKNYNPDEICLAVMTDAVHEETGAEYTFPSGCLPPGWEPVPMNPSDSMEPQ